MEISSWDVGIYSPRVASSSQSLTAGRNKRHPDMANISLLAAVALATLLVVPYVHAAGGNCYAPPFIYGSECRSNTGVIGSPGWTVHYSVSVNGNGGTLVCCDAKYCDTRGCRMRSIGCGHSSFGSTLPWGNTIATPSVKCKGTPFGASVRFVH